MAGTYKSSYSTQKFAAHIRSIGQTIAESQRNAVNEAALILKRSIEHETAVATKGSMGFSRMDTKVNRNGSISMSRSNWNSRLRVGYDIVGERNPTALLVARGPWGLIEYGSVAHEIIPRLDTISRRGPALARQRKLTQRRLDVAFGATGVFAGVAPLSPSVSSTGEPRYRVNHPGTKGKKPFHRGIQRATPMASRVAMGVIQNTVVSAIRKGRTTWMFSSTDGYVGSKSDFGSLGSVVSSPPGS